MKFFINKIFSENKFIFVIFFLISISFYSFLKENNPKFITNINVDIKEDNFNNTNFAKIFNFNNITTDKKNILLDNIKRDFNITSVKIINKNKIRLVIILEHEENINFHEIKNFIEINLLNNLNDSLNNMRVNSSVSEMSERTNLYKYLHIYCNEMKKEQLYNNCLESIIFNDLYLNYLFKENHNTLLLLEKNLIVSKIFNVNSKTIEKNYKKKLLNYIFINIILFILIFFFYKKLKKNLLLIR
jgi:hypothetical protein